MSARLTRHAAQYRHAQHGAMKACSAARLLLKGVQQALRFVETVEIAEHCELQHDVAMSDRLALRQSLHERA